ncbi:MAG: DNA helicase RecQ [Rhizobiales bacterium]|nr:DNA helicase RecQ [Hyphomicrobiales bacterium]
MSLSHNQDKDTAFGQDAACRQILGEVFGFPDFRPGQEDVIATLGGGRNVLAVMPTGSGKSLCYQVPALVGDGLSLVVSPLVALMEDQVAALKLAGVAAETINSGRDRETNVTAWRRVAAGEARLLYLSPERLMTDRMLAALSHLNVRLIAVDEAHCISQWGASFRPDYRALEGLRAAFPSAAIGAFTATADEVTRQDVLARLFGGDARVFVHGFDRPNISLSVTPKKNIKTQILSVLEAHRGTSGIVYCLSRRKTEEVAEHLARQGYLALAYHAGMTAEQRTENQNRFMSEPAIVMVATIAFGMGIDKPDVRFVVHADLPASIEAYYQEIGRAGRDGAPAEAHLFYGLGDVRMRRQFIVDENTDESRQRREFQRLDALLGYCEAPECRRVTLLTYFGEDSTSCGNCDVCASPGIAEDGTEEARTILNAIAVTGERFGAAHIADFVTGTETEKLMQLGHHLRIGFATGAKRPKKEWRSLIRQVVAAGLAETDISGFGGLRLTGKGKAFRAGNGEFRYRPDRFGATPLRENQASAAAGALDANGEELLARLKALRLDIARQQNVPAYVVFADRTLIDMAARQPANRDEFAEVHGVGAAKLRKFGDQFIGEIAAFARG